MEREIGVVVHGALGRMGRVILTALLGTPGIALVGAIDVAAATDKLHVSETSTTIPLFRDIKTALQTCQAKVMVDFSVASAALEAIKVATLHKINVVTGTSGLKQADLLEMETLGKQYNTCIIIGPNFALGAVLMMHLAKISSRYFDTAEIIEMHHDQKADSPSGTAIATARIMSESRGSDFRRPFTHLENIKGCRGGESAGITIHSVRLPGLMAHQEIIFGLSGQTLTIRHDTLGRECYIPGILLAIREAVKRKGVIYGLENLLNL